MAVIHVDKGPDQVGDFLLEETEEYKKRVEEKRVEADRKGQERRARERKQRKENEEHDRDK